MPVKRRGRDRLRAAAHVYRERHLQRGLRVRKLPLSPENVLRALKKARRLAH